MIMNELEKIISKAFEEKQNVNGNSDKKIIKAAAIDPKQINTAMKIVFFSLIVLKIFFKNSL